MAARYRRRRRQRNQKAVSERFVPIRAVQGAVKQRPLKTITTQRRRVLGAVGRNEKQRAALDRILSRRRRHLSSKQKKNAVRSISLLERSQTRLRGKGGPCIRRPDPKKAGEIRQRGTGGGSKEQRLKSFRLWC